MNAYTPRRCGARWLDGDCPKEVLAIFDLGKNETDRYDVFYAELNSGSTYSDGWLTFLCINEAGATYHGEMEAYKVAAYRYRMKHRYAAWSSLPDVVRAAVRRDLAACYQCNGNGPYTFEEHVCDSCVRSNARVGA